LDAAVTSVFAKAVGHQLVLDCFQCSSLTLDPSTTSRLNCPCPPSLPLWPYCTNGWQR